MIAYIIFLCEFPTDFDGELIALYIDKDKAYKRFDKLYEMNSGYYIREVEISQ